MRGRLGRNLKDRTRKKWESGYILDKMYLLWKKKFKLA